MVIDFKVMGFDAAAATLAVRYVTSDIPEGIPLLVRVPRVDGAYPEGEELLVLIAIHAPLALLIAAERGEQLPSGLENSVQEPHALFADGVVLVTPEQRTILSPRTLVDASELPLPVEVL